MRDIRKHIDRAKDLGIEIDIEIDIETVIPHKYRNDIINTEDMSIRFIHDNLVQLGQLRGSYEDALMIYFNKGIVDEDFFETDFMQQSIFKRLLEIELNDNNAFGRNYDMEEGYDFI